MREETPALVELAGITKHFGRVTVLDGVDFCLKAGEVHALLGENGAGKSTLMNVLGGVIRPDKGELRLGGRRVIFHHPSEAQRAGVSFVHQEVCLLPHLTVAQNLWLGHEPRRRFGLLDHRRLDRESEALLRRLETRLDPRQPVSELPVAEQQLVQIAKALSLQSRVLVLDEPTASLTGEETERLFGLVRRLRAEGVGVIYITHRLAEVFQVADRASFLKDGRYVGTRPVAGLTHDEIVALMVGRRPAGAAIERPREAPGEPALAVTGLLCRAAAEPVTLAVRRGEIVGLTGLVGAGRTELLRAIFGADPAAVGEVQVRGRKVPGRSPAGAIRAGLGFVTEDRKAQGLVLCLSVVKNASMVTLSRFARLGFLRRKAERREAVRSTQALAVAARPDQAVGSLSGGNQQKVVLAKWLLAQPSVLLLDEPTRGIDVGAREEFYQIIRELARQGAGILLSSSDLPEILKVSDRILVMRERRLVSEFAAGEASEEVLFRAAAGLSPQDGRI